MIPHLGIPELIVILFIIRNFKDATKDGARIENGAKDARPADRS